MGSAGGRHLVDSRVVDDLIGDVHSLLRVLFARLVGHLHSTFDAPAVTVGLCQGHCDILLYPLVAICSHLRN